ncbi:hypothetical protein [Streptomyces natalensis]|uniref:Cold-shock protein n=1 Tax=Streptomyces natalensis ATCC 27448 TaxID=1240678 RepID=A0A0D7CL30_9ACTN|nr:hypothetical protein [Streptomyces natalensis]KIZ16162.1 hypothetical protein SNA_23445 [Streptomyces natalensis ATCC 27448]
MSQRRSGTVQAVSEARKEAVIRADEDGADVLAAYTELSGSDGDRPTMRVGERVTYTREEQLQGPIARDIRASV